METPSQRPAMKGNEKPQESPMNSSSSVAEAGRKTGPGLVPTMVKKLPRRFRTAFILFSSARHKEIREQLGQQATNATTANLAKIVSNEWKTMSPEEKRVWNEKARHDKARFDAEMAEYEETTMSNGGSEPDVPKRPMSAYLAFSNQRRAALKRANPDATNAELSKMLSKAWKEAPPSLKAEYIEHEAKLRAQYSIDMMPWRNKKPRKHKKLTKKHVGEDISSKEKSCAEEQAAKTAQSGHFQDYRLLSLRVDREEESCSMQFPRQQLSQCRMPSSVPAGFESYFQSENERAVRRATAESREALSAYTALLQNPGVRLTPYADSTNGCSPIRPMALSFNSVDSANLQQLYAAQQQPSATSSHMLALERVSDAFENQVISRLQGSLMLERALACQPMRIREGFRDLPSLYEHSLMNNDPLFPSGRLGTSCTQAAAASTRALQLQLSNDILSNLRKRSFQGTL